MSEFDKEKERERLREKYERDKQKREATERMSELLLQGATMTNAHCSECGDPIFRYDDQEFCPTCERPIERAKPNDTDDADSSDSIEVTTPKNDARVQFGDGNTNSSDGENTNSDQSATGEQPTERQSDATQTQPERTLGQHSSREGKRVQPSSSTKGEPTADLQTGGQQPAIDTARQSLTRTLVAFSQRAEATDDPRRAREHLQAAREAAETLKTLR